MVSVFFSHPPLYLSRQDLSNPGPPILVSTASQLTPGDHLSASQVLGLQKATVPACLLWRGLGGIQTQVLTLAHETLCPLSHPLSSPLSF